VPTIIRYPGVIEPDSVSYIPSIGMDLFVTILNQTSARVPVERMLDGIDLSPIFSGADIPKIRNFFWALAIRWNKDYVSRRGDWQLILDSDHKPIELYNLKEDLLEIFNRLHEEKNIVAQLTDGFSAIWTSIQNGPLRPN
tara:strand:+ start:872 stop:1291 length:420 start_codon:yes stop_codon:yes gene_type:complete